MNVSCTSCSAKYAIPDEKVRGKKVKITCKHCGTGIIVDGTKIDAASEAPAAAPATAPAAAPAPAPAPVATAPMPAVTAKVAAPPATLATELSFDIAYPDDRQETLSVSEIVDKYAAGTLDDSAFLWREGMTDWKAPFDIPELKSALGARGLKPGAPAAAALTSPFADDDEATKIQESPFDGVESQSSVSGVWREPAMEAPSSPEAAFDLRAPAALPFETDERSASPRPAAASPRPAAVAAAKPDAPKPAAARRSAARGGGDLFGDLAGAGSEEDESLGAEAKDAAPKLTGARNESSVLFSLDALVKQEQKPAATKKSAAAKQEDAAAILMGTDSGPSSIANVGTGSFGSAFAAPDFNAPVMAPPPETRASDPVELPNAAPAKKGLGLWIGIAAVIALAAGAVATGLPAKLAGTPPAPTPSAPVAAVTTPSAAPTPEAAPVATTPSAAPAASTAPLAGASAPTPAAAATPGAAAAKPVDGAARPTEKPAEKPAEKPTEKPIEKPAEVAASNEAPFDKSAAIAALSAAAGNAQSCKTPDGPTGGGKVSITFMPSGRATNTQVSGDLAGTAVGGCVARLFRSAKVPPFSGEAVTVSKSFSVQ